MSTKQELPLTVMFEEEEEGGYTVTVPSFPGCVSYGKTMEVAKKNIQNALKLHVACIKAHSGSKKKLYTPKNIFTAVLHFKTA